MVTENVLQTLHESGVLHDTQDGIMAAGGTMYDTSPVTSGAPAVASVVAQPSSEALRPLSSVVSPVP